MAPLMSYKNNNLIVNYLPSDMSEDELAGLFWMCGETKSVKIVRDERTGDSLGYGFVVFAKHCNASAGQILLNGHKIRGKCLKVDYARPRSEERMNANLYVSCLPLDLDENKLIELFEGCGNIIEAKILRDKVTGKSRGTGFVRFDLHSSALKARDTLNFYSIDGSTRPIEVKFSGPMKKKKEAVEGPITSKEETDVGAIELKEETDVGPIELKKEAVEGPIESKEETDLGPIQSKEETDVGPIKLKEEQQTYDSPNAKYISIIFVLLTFIFFSTIVLYNNYTNN